MKQRITRHAANHRSPPAPTPCPPLLPISPESSRRHPSPASSFGSAPRWPRTAFITAARRLCRRLAPGSSHTSPLQQVAAGWSNVGPRYAYPQSSSISRRVTSAQVPDGRQATSTALHSCCGGESPVKLTTTRLSGPLFALCNQEEPIHYKKHCVLAESNEMLADRHHRARPSTPASVAVLSLIIIVLFSGTVA